MDAGTALAPGAVSSITPCGKYLIFFSRKGRDALADKFGAPFVAAVGDVCATSAFARGDLAALAAQQLNALAQKVSARLGLTLSAGADVRDHVAARCTPEQGAAGLAACCDKIFRALSEYCLQTDKKLTGTVTDENGAPVTGATVIVVGTQRGTTTSATGAYTLQVRNGEILEFQYLGYEKQAVSVGGQTTLDVTLQPSKAMAVDEVVVIGYGTVKKGDATGSVANIKISDVKDLPVLSVDQALQGRVAGADIMSTTGEPGATTSIRIRGTRSISASNEPLIVVDGVMDAVSDLNDLNMADIESVTILKDASSTAIYGSRGSNGVIIVTTKGGGNQTNTKPSITLKADIGFSQLPRKLDVMNATEFALYRNDFAYFSTQSGYEDIGEGTPQSKYPFKAPFSLGKGTDWIDEITRTAPYQNYSLSISGRSKKSSYYASLGYNDSQGIIDNSGLQRITGRLNLAHQLFKWLKVGYRGSYTWRDNAQNLAEIGGTAYYRAAMYLSPHIDPQENYNPLWGNGQRINTPRATIDQNTYSIERTSVSYTHLTLPTNSRV